MLYGSLLQIDPHDDVAVALRPLQANEAACDGVVLATASGRATQAEQNGEREIALWKRGVTL